jgi:tRNA threonylcarbamoyladenosine biosynthesis protein TsaE
MLTVQSYSEEQTYRLGKLVGRNVNPGDIILLFGDMGSGKTVFSKGIAHGADVSGTVTSPTYTIMNTYIGRIPIFHFDIYRLNEPEELYDLDYEEYFFGRGVSIVEWPERLDYLLPEEYFKVTLCKMQEENGRKIVFEAVGNRYTSLERVLLNYESVGY